MKALLIVILVAAMAAIAQAQLVVTDPIGDALSRVQHAEEVLKYVEMINTQIDQLVQIEAYVKAFGNPEELLDITGANELIGSLQQLGVGLNLAELQELAEGVEAMEYDGNGIFTGLSPSFLTPSGVEGERDEEMYRKFGAIQQSSRNFQEVSEDVTERRTQLREQIATTTEQLQAATTDAETQKLTGVLVGYTAELEAVDREVDQAAAQIAAQDAENRADKERQEQARREERQAEMEESFRNYGEVFRIETSPPQFPPQ